MLKRTITGFFILLALAGFIALRQVSVLFFDGFVLFVIYGCLFEILSSRGYHKHRLSSALLYIYPAVLAAIYILSPSLLVSLVSQVLAFVAYFIVFMLMEVVRAALERKTRTEEVTPEGLLTRTKEAMEILLYPVTLLGFLFALNHMGLEKGYMALILSLSITIFTDVFAYLFGRMIKGPKFAPEISPNKTISGCCFGALGGIIIAVVCWVIFANVGWFVDNSAATYSFKFFWIFFACGILGTLATMFGDLVESAYKRKLEIKDFGNILPGHGGIMDRVDGLMMTATLVFAIFALFM